MSNCKKSVEPALDRASLNNYFATFGCAGVIVHNSSKAGHKGPLARAHEGFTKRAKKKIGSFFTMPASQYSREQRARGIAFGN